ncbi:MAG TPA: FAD binding domain-containing protein [Thermoanaerobaculia bacterium]|jgi:4-hydroxybenzoyl-CoA reductase subunit beta|nr:FAD binding domain-containing protein [Thermoanaerobaculia bacterium]
MLRLPRFDFVHARTLEEAASALSGEGAAEGQSVRLVAGGTDLWPNMKRRHQQASTVVSLMGIPGLAGIDVNGEIHIGATTLLNDVVAHPAVRQRYPGFATAVQSISSPPLRNMGTIGGNLCVDTRCTYYNQTEEWRRSIDYCMKAEGSICWVATSSPRCWAHTATDSAPMACALGATVKLVSKDGERVIPLDDLYRDDGMAYLAKRPDEILTALHLPADATADRCRSAFWKLRRRGSIDFAVLSAAAAVWTAPDGTVEKARIYLGAVASRPLAAQESADFLLGKKLDEETIAAAAKLTRKVATPMDNTDFQTQWRGTMVQRYTEAALREVAGLDTARLAPKHGLPVLE